MPRPRKALETNKKHFTLDEKRSRAASEAAFRVPRTELLDFDSLKDFGLSEAAISEFKRIVGLANWLDDLDRNDLIAYCLNWDRARIISTSPDSRKELIQATRGDGSKRILHNPLWAIWQQCCKEMRSISLKLGFAQTDRLKLVAPTVDEQQPNKFLQFLARKDG